MTKFKVGDKVEILYGTGGLAYRYKGTIGVISDIDDDGDYIVTVHDGDYWYYTEQELKLADELNDVVLAEDMFMDLILLTGGY